MNPFVFTLGSTLLSFLMLGLAELAKRVFIALGFTSLTVFGLSYLFNQMTSIFSSSLNGLPSDVLAIVGLMQLDICFSMIMSAGITKQILLGWNRATDSISKDPWHNPTTNGTTGTLGG